MTPLAWDTSAALKLVADEPGSVCAREVYAAKESGVTLDWTSLELASALWKRAMQGAASSDAAELALETFDRLDFEIVRAAPLSATALSLALRLRHPVYDCMYLALALQTRASLVTADRRLREIAETAGVRVVWIAAT